MDGAQYHRRQVNKAPAQKERKATIAAWIWANKEQLAAAGAQIPATEAELRKWKKDALYRLIQRNRPPVKTRVFEIAGEYGHEVLYTPPYHPELQPIEIVWGVIKNSLADTMGWDKMAELVEFVREAAQLPSEQTFLGSRRGSVLYEVEYAKEFGLEWNLSLIHI